MSKQIVCNLCGKTIDYYGPESTATIHGKMEFDSVYNGQMIHMDICAECLDKIVADCIISPFINASEDDDDEDDLHKFFPYFNM